MIFASSTCSPPNGEQCPSLRINKNPNNSDDSRARATVFIIGIKLISANIVIYNTHA
jgi:hypothetical protein